MAVLWQINNINRNYIETYYIFFKPLYYDLILNRSIMELKRVTKEEVRQKALPIIMAGYKKRKSLRSHSEELLRSPEKLARDKRSSCKPRLSPI